MEGCSLGESAAMADRCDALARNNCSLQRTDVQNGVLSMKTLTRVHPGSTETQAKLCYAETLKWSAMKLECQNVTELPTFL